VRQLELRVHIDDLVVDSFAGGGGASLGIELALGRSPDVAINHDPEAIAMHAVNHPRTRHFCESVWDVDPVVACRGRRVGLMWLSPDCTFHSKARGGQPFRDRNRARRRRGLAWVAIRWARSPVRPRVITLENVEEFKDWGPVLYDGTPCPLRRGLTFRRWWAQLENLGYQVVTYAGIFLEPRWESADAEVLRIMRGGV
jgi:DNA (cytosine-5)-methyltransferase 1